MILSSVDTRASGILRNVQRLQSSVIPHIASITAVAHHPVLSNNNTVKTLHQPLQSRATCTNACGSTRLLNCNMFQRWSAYHRLQQLMSKYSDDELTTERHKNDVCSVVNCIHSTPKTPHMQKRNHQTSNHGNRYHKFVHIIDKSKLFYNRENKHPSPPPIKTV